MPTILILGCGMIGSTMAIDLAKDRTFHIRLVDRNLNALERAAQRVKDITGVEVETIESDLSASNNVTNLARDADVVLGALSSVIGYQTLRAVIESETPYVDISFMPENPLELDELAREYRVPAVVDCGVAPGLSNLLAAHCAAEIEDCRRISICVGGLPRERLWPFEYKAAFSPHDVIEEYTRPARFVENGEVVVREALSEPELLEFNAERFSGVGTLEAFNTDGLRTLIDTLDVPNMTEKTLRYPGHAELMRIFRETGLFSHEAIEVNGACVRPIDLTSRLLFPKWKYDEGEADVTVMRIRAEGVHEGAARSIVWELFDEYDPETRCSSMSRTTAFPATLIAGEILSGGVTQVGILPPERLIADDGLVSRMLDGLRERGVRIDRVST